VVDEADGRLIRASYIAVVRESTSGVATGSRSKTVSSPPSERDVASALVDEDVRRMADGDSLYRYVRKYYVKKGDGPVEPGDVHDLRRLTVVHPASDRDWVVSPRAPMR
jgi:hypothetical protein